MKDRKEIIEDIERLKRINQNAPYDKEMFDNITIQINTLSWVIV